GGAMTGGAFKNSSNLLGRRREIEELQKRVESLRLDLEKIGEEAKENRQKRNLLRESLEEIQKEIQSLQIQKNTAKMGVDSARENLEKLQLSYEKLQTERNEIQAQLNDIEKNSVDILQEMESSRAEEEKLKEESDKGQEALENLQTLERKEQERMEQIRLEYANITQKAGFNEQNQRRLQEEIKSLQEELKKIEEDGKKSSGGSLDKEKEIESYQTGIENISQEIKKLEEEIKNLVESKSALSKEHKSFFEKRDQLSERMNLLDKECYRLNNQKEKIEDARESKITYLWEEYELTPQGAIGLRQEDLKDRGEMKKSIHLLREQIRSLGNVNVNAIEEYKEVSERHEFLSGQYEDLIKAEETLVGIIEELDAGMRKQFNEKFAQIQQEFDKAFKELFGGGKGSLVLDDTSEDILEAGISIISQPPGKKLQNMMQLSGGEKALTAIALLFAIQNLKPSPFCLLDEIEAALDDSNVVRYAGYLHKLTKNTQFIIITHRRGTMNAADRLYGITMQEKGVSTLVSVNLIENELEK
ncbi:MAG TPA: chromosome segregation protein SMC, partial [Lachnospiraceae bacterium]